VRQASRYYSEKVLEYPAKDEAIFAYLRYPGTALLLSAIEKLIEALHNPCRSLRVNTAQGTILGADSLLQTVESLSALSATEPLLR
jgi:hypothetical protein